MIPDDMVKKAWRAYIGNKNKQAFLNEFLYPDLRGPMPPPPEPWQSIRAALEAVAADIWDEGEKAGYIHGQHDTHRFDPGPDWHETPNPYRNEHA